MATKEDYDRRFRSGTYLLVPLGSRDGFDAILDTEYRICLHLLHHSDHICTPWTLFVEGANGLERQLVVVAHMPLCQRPRRRSFYCLRRYPQAGRPSMSPRTVK